MEYKLLYKEFCLGIGSNDPVWVANCNNIDEAKLLAKQDATKNLRNLNRYYIQYPLFLDLT